MNWRNYVYIEKEMKTKPSFQQWNLQEGVICVVILALYILYIDAWAKHKHMIMANQISDQHMFVFVKCDQYMPRFVMFSADMLQ